jgi:hypothetical protein
MIGLVVIIVIDTSIVKVYDLVNKFLIPQQAKLVLFSINTSFCLLLEYIIIKYTKISSNIRRLDERLSFNTLYRISLISLSIVTVLMGLLIFQQFYNSYYYEIIPILIIIITYGTTAGLLLKLSTLFISWYKSNHNSIVLLYFISISLIAFNLVMTAIITTIKIIDRPDITREFVGGMADISVGKYVFLQNIYTISSIVSFISIWITTALLMTRYREKLISAIIYWIILAIPLFYFFVNYFYQLIFADVLISYLTIDPITVSVALTAFLSLSKPIGGLTFAVAFWKISNIISYEKNVRTYMIISGWGILLIFGADQAVSQALAPYPAFGLATITVLIIAAFLMVLGIYNSATFVSVNNELRKSIYKHALESNLLGLIGQAEMEKEIQKTVKKITQDLETDGEIPVPVEEIDEEELKRYIDLVVKEVKKEDKH